MLLSKLFYATFFLLLMAGNAKYSSKTKEKKAHSICKNGSIVYDQCGQRCICQKGKLVHCCRERKDFTSMSHKERKAYINAILQASTDKAFKKKYLDIIHIHNRHFDDGIHEIKQFLPWHRWYLLHFENFMRQINCKFTIPYWDWSYYRDDPFSEKFDDIWSPEDHGLGGNGHGKDDCVKTGPFAFKRWKTTLPFGNCLQRKFNSTMILPSLAFLYSSPEDFEYFEWYIRSEIHDYVHDMICGHMCSKSAAADPFFWMHHGFVDKLWDEWQRKSDDHKNAYYNVVISEKPMVNKLMPASFMDSMKLPGGVRVCYVDSKHKYRKREIFSREETQEQISEKYPHREYMVDYFDFLETGDVDE